MTFPVVANNSVQNYAQQNAAATQVPATVQFDTRNAAIAETQTRQAVKVSDSSNRSEEARERRADRQEARERAQADRVQSRDANRGRNVDVSV